ncbi:cytochrome b [Aquabacterium sp.]|uniref:cytochrome b n=1 Tax=Aquabacterium sp. TaxID=1872578 RepID=UPI003782DD6F
MTQPASTTHYDPASRALHWVTALVVLVAFILGPEHFGRLMRNGLDPATRSDIVWHETLGVLVFVLTALRLVWAALRPSPPQFPMAPWMAFAAKALHLALWALLLLLPVTALLALGSEDHPLTLLGGFRIDHMPPIAQSPIARLADWGDVHQVLGDAIIWLAGLHAAAAVFHHVVLKDGVLRGMLGVR